MDRVRDHVETGRAVPCNYGITATTGPGMQVDLTYTVYILPITNQRYHLGVWARSNIEDIRNTE